MGCFDSARDFQRQPASATSRTAHGPTRALSIARDAAATPRRARATSRPQDISSSTGSCARHCCAAVSCPAVSLLDSHAAAKHFAMPSALGRRRYRTATHVISAMLAELLIRQCIFVASGELRRSPVIRDFARQRRWRRITRRLPFHARCYYHDDVDFSHQGERLIGAGHIPGPVQARSPAHGTTCSLLMPRRVMRRHQPVQLAGMYRHARPNIFSPDDLDSHDAHWRAPATTPP